MRKEGLCLQAGSTMEPVNESPQISALKVLVIDDNQAHSEGLAELLVLAGFQASYVLTGCEGIETARELGVDAVLLDMNLPDINGFEVCRRLRGDVRTAHVAVVFHTAKGSVPGERHPGDAFLTYPVPMKDVCAVIRASVERRKSGTRRIYE
jgi:DNA-binding response OmpR family regulator